MDTGVFRVISTQTTSEVRVRRLASTSGPRDTIPVREQWVWANHDAMQSFARGKEDVRAGRVLDLGSFAQYADLDVDD
jgi:hypothetical protein